MSAPLVCFYFQVHQPYRLQDLRARHIGSKDITYFDDDKNRAIFRKVAEKCYLPTNKLMLDLLNAYPWFSISYSLSGVFLDQCREYGQDVLESFQALANTNRVEFLAETYYHSLSSIKSLPEFCQQVTKHVKTIQELFGQTPRVFRNTELIFNNEIAQITRMMGFKGIIAEGADHLLRNRTPNVPYEPPRFRLAPDKEKAIRANRPLPMRSDEVHILLKNYRLSDDIAFRFSDRNWAAFPLFADTYAEWLGSNQGHSINLFMDYETFGEHQWESTGIFDFMRSLPEQMERKGMKTATPSEVLDAWKDANHTETYDVHTTISWADMERDLSAWQGNHIQKSALDAVYALEKAIKDSGDAELLETWRRLQTSDHFYYMCTKYWSDGDVHKYFSPYDSPYEAYRRFSHALCDLRSRVTEIENGKVKMENSVSTSGSQII
ncbi:MAG TPA: glycoside hydrolase family 57 protein [Candidatus Peribacteraceae bacterium]|nr:glycoside hydrolase family 57 protein [Candidatus Peribacteraceae bacterium]